MRRQPAANLGEQSAALLAAIKEYEASKWKVIGQKVGKPAKVGLRNPSNEQWNIHLTCCHRPANSMPRSTSVGGYKTYISMRGHGTEFLRRVRRKGVMAQDYGNEEPDRAYGSGRIPTRFFGTGSTISFPSTRDASCGFLKRSYQTHVFTKGGKTKAQKSIS